MDILCESVVQKLFVLIVLLKNSFSQSDIVDEQIFAADR